MGRTIVRRVTPCRAVRRDERPAGRSTVFTSNADRQNLTMRMHMRRLTRLANACSKTFENFRAAEMKPPLNVALIALAALAILLTVGYIWRRNTSPDFESHSELIGGPHPTSK